MIPGEEVEAIIGHAIGGVCPFAVNDNVKIYLSIFLIQGLLIQLHC